MGRKEGNRKGKKNDGGSSLGWVGARAREKYHIRVTGIERTHRSLWNIRHPSVYPRLRITNFDDILAVQ
jgi:hypothetical protein